MKNKLLIPSLFIALSISVIGGSKFTYAKVLADSEYRIVETGQVINVESRTLVHDAESKVADSQIIFPDGSSKAGKSFTISMPGVYRVIYSATFGAEVINETIFYKCYRTSANMFISSNEKNQPSTGEYTYNTKTSNIQGAVLTLDSHTTFTYDGVIDFNTFGSNNPFFEFMVDTEKQGESDLDSFTIRLTDVDDFNNYVDITVKDSGPVDDDGKGCYILAGSNAQFKTGFEWGRLHTNSYGTNVGSSFRALPVENPAHSAKLYFDYGAKTLYVSPIHGSTNKDIITDLDSPAIYKSSAWEGFTNGKATLSVFANALISSSANVVVPRVANVDLSQMIFEDNTSPRISIDKNGQTGDIPNAQVGRPYKIFDAIVTDNFDKNLSYDVTVTYRDETNNKNKDVSIINGYFTPTKPGSYVVKYQTRDSFYNSATSTMEIVAVNNIQNMSISLDAQTMSDTVYSSFILPNENDVHVTGGSGKPYITRQLVDPSNQEIIIEGDEFIPEEAGTYQARYIARDYLGNVATTVLTINVLEATTPKFVGNVLLPRVLVKGHTYTLPEYKGVETVNGKSVFLDSKVYVNGTELANRTFVAGDTCSISYKIIGQNGQNEYPATIDVVDSNNSQDQAVYFHGDFDSVTENMNDVTLASSHDASAVFATVLPYDNPLVGFVRKPNKSNFNSLIFKFSDSLNPDVSLSFKVRFNNASTYISVGNDPTVYEFVYEMRDEEETYIINFNNSSRTLMDIAYNDIIKVNKDDQGNLFTGFKHGVYLDISMVGVTSSSEVAIKSISNQDFGHNLVYMDITSPIVIFNKRFVNEQLYGANGYIPSVEVFDVLSDASATVMVKAPDGTFKLRNEDASVDHNFPLDSFGSYIVTYRAEDSSGNFASYPRKIMVFDNVDPVLTVNNNLKESYKLNSAVTIPSYTASDNLGSYTLDIFLMMPNGEERLLILDRSGEVTSYLSADSPIYNSSFKVNSNTFRVEQTGKYTLRYVLYDEAYNRVIQEYSFMVK